MKLKGLIDKLSFSLEELPAVILSQPKLMLSASHYRVQKLRKRQEVEAAFNRINSDAALKLREEGGKKTEAYIRQKCEILPEVIQAQAELDEAKVLEVWGKHLLDAYHERGSMIKALVQLMGAEAALEMKFIREEHLRMGGKELRRRVQAKYPGQEEDE